jgi:exopolysaccharide biosynthesis polyprenyl glycosylphosphotransferase
VGDLAVVAIAFLAAFATRIYLPLPWTVGLLPADRISFFFGDLPVLLLGQPLILYFFGFYDPPDPGTRQELPRRLMAAMTVLGLLLMGYYFLSERTFPRSIVVLFSLYDFALLYVWRTVWLRPPEGTLRRIAIVGHNPAAVELARSIRKDTWHPLEIVGFVPNPEGDPAAPGSGKASQVLGPCLGTVEDLPRLVAEGVVEDVILASAAYQWQGRLIDGLARSGVDRGNILLLPSPFESLIGRMRYRWVSDLPLIEVMRQSEWRFDRPLKRGLDLLLATLLLVVLSPALMVAVLAVRLTSAGPILYRQTRVGRGRTEFSVRKLRTMRPNAESATGEVLAQPNDPRLTPVGGFLRRTRLDEIPQLINVLEGTMSLVGPRPERPSFVDRFVQEIPGYAERFSMPPGLTGLAQVSGHYHSTAENKLRHDLAYIANWSLWLDLSILLKTVKIVLTSRGV